MLASKRLLEIEKAFEKQLLAIVPLQLDGETLRLILYLHNKTTLRVTEQWLGQALNRYSYYWLTPTNTLKIGWDNAPHHTRLKNHPHHKHVGHQDNRQPSYETSLEDVMAIILNEN